MIDDPIVIRKARGALIVSSTNPTDPIQLIRQVSTTELEVHLNNGSKYVENFADADMHQIIMEMMGYVTYEVYLTTTMWPHGQEGKLKFRGGLDLQCAGAKAFRTIFSETPYLKNKFLQVALKKTETERTYYDSVYSRYAVECMFGFRGRIDMRDEIWAEFADNVPDLVKHFVDGPAWGYGSAMAEDGSAKIKQILE